MLLETNGNDLIEAVAMSYDFALIEAAALHKIARRSAEAHEWFWPNARGDDIYYHSVGDCSQLSQVLRSKSKEERLYNLAMESPAAMYMEEEDLCFSALARRFGFKLHVLPSVQYGRTVPVRLSLSAYREDVIGRTAGSSLLEKISFPHDAFVVQNKLSDLKKGKKLVQVGSPTGARVVLATPVWQNLVCDHQRTRPRTFIFSLMHTLSYARTLPLTGLSHAFCSRSLSFFCVSEWLDFKLTCMLGIKCC